MNRRPIIEEKRIHSIKVSVGETLYRQLQDLAALRERSLSDYCHSQLLRSVYGESLGLRRQSDSPGQSDPE